MKQLAIFFPLFLFIPMLFAQQFDVVDFRHSPSDLAAIRYERIDVNGEKCAIIKVRSNIEGIRFDANLGIEGNPVFEDGEVWLYISPGERRIKLMREGFITMDYNLPVRIEAASVYVLELIATLPDDPAAEVNFGFVFIKSEPEEAEVFINGKPTGRFTPYQQMDDAGDYTYELRKDMYFSYEGRFTIKPNETTTLEPKLQPNFGFLSVKSNPESGATVVIDGRSYGVTPLLIDKLAPGTYNLTLRLELYQSLEQQFSIRQGETTTLDLTMKPLFGMVNVKTTPAADIFVNNQHMGSGNWEGRLPLGNQMIEARLRNHQPETKRVVVEAGKLQDVAFTLLPITGRLAVMSTPPEASIWINGKDYGKTPAIIPDLLVGDYDIILKKKDFGDTQGKVLIKENETTQLNLTLNTETIPAAKPVVAEKPVMIEKPVEKERPVPEVIKTEPVEQASETPATPPTEKVMKDDMGIEMIFVKGGKFNMGCTDEQKRDCWPNEEPSFQVVLSDYYIGKYEITQKQWREVMGSNPRHLYFTRCDDCPVESVSWNDAGEFIAKLNQLTGKNYRLPTEAEWEYAARGGIQQANPPVNRYSGSDRIRDVAHFFDNSNGRTHPVGKLQANELGIYDMSGNVAEWCADWFGDYNRDSKTNPQGPASGSLRVARGGSWGNDARSCRITHRESRNPAEIYSRIGFRIALSL
jgi:formylglycine-generating enzyme required for sulfatase activity